MDGLKKLTMAPLLLPEKVVLVTATVPPFAFKMAPPPRTPPALLLAEKVLLVTLACALL